MKRWPMQLSDNHERVSVIFEYGQQPVYGVLVRCDAEAPYTVIIKLDDGHYVLGNECVYRLIK